MRMLVADSNALRHRFLRDYLSRSVSNKIVISDLTVIEMRKRNSLVTSRESLRILAGFPSQVYLVRPTYEIIDLKIDDSSSTSLMFDYEGSVEIQGLAAKLQALPVSKGLVEKMCDFERLAVEQHHALIREVLDLEGGMVDACKEFTIEELAEIRRGTVASDSTKRKIFELLKETVGQFIIKNFEKSHGSSISLGSIKNTFAFRYSLCMMMYYVEWVQIGRQRLAEGKNRANDVVDMQIAAIATFFNGVLSGDRRLQGVSRSTRAILRGWNGFVGDDCQL